MFNRISQAFVFLIIILFLQTRNSDAVTLNFSKYIDRWKNVFLFLFSRVENLKRKKNLGQKMDPLNFIQIITILMHIFVPQINVEISIK